MTHSHDVIIKKLTEELAHSDRPENRHNYQRFHKEKLKEPEGLKAAVLRKISNQCFREIRTWPAKDILELCEHLLASSARYMRFFSFDWAGKLRGKYGKSDFKRFERWLGKHVENWGNCDHLCCGALGHLIVQYPELVGKTKPWTKSKNQWLRRGAAVSLIVPLSNGMMLNEIFDTADRLLTDEEDLVQKGYGWALKVAGNTFQKEVFTYVMHNRDNMPRTALRYAIEKMPPAMRKKAMAKPNAKKEV